MSYYQTKHIERVLSIITQVLMQYWQANHSSRSSHMDWILHY